MCCVFYAQSVTENILLHFKHDAKWSSTRRADALKIRARALLLLLLLVAWGGTDVDEYIFAKMYRAKPVEGKAFFFCYIVYWRG